jgi:hypothetical protein
MGMAAIRLQPGINTERTPTLNSVGFSDGAFIRWKEGMVEKLGGWAKFFPNSVGSIIRALHSWQDLNGNNRLGVGSVSSLKVVTSGTIIDITPQETTTNTNPPNFSTVNGSTTITVIDANISNPSTNDFIFIATPVAIGGLILFGIYAITVVLSATSYKFEAASAATATVNNAGTLVSYATTNGSAQVTVTLTNHGFTLGQTYTSLVSTTVGGVTIFGNYQVQAPVAANTFVINVSNLATSTTSGSQNGGAIQTIYYIQLGPQPLSAGWGVGSWGSGSWGTGLAPPQGVGTPITATDYSLLNFGEIFIANPAGGPLFQWGPESSFLNAGIVNNGPIIADGCFLAQPQQIIVAWGASFNGALNPLRLAWCDAGNFNIWTPTATNFAGGFTISRGSRIVSCIQGGNQFIVLTDIGCWSGQYIGQPLVFSIIEIMAGCGLVGRKAVGTAGTTIYWMSQEQFFMMAAGGVPTPMDCSVWDRVFQRIDTANFSKVRFFANSNFSEIGWYYPTLPSLGGNGENDSYVKYNRVENEWDVGPMGRSAWIDSSILGPPIGGTTGGIIYQHEVSPDADGVAMTPFIQTGDFSIEQGEEFGFVDWVLPDAKFGLDGQPQTASMLCTVNAKAYATDDISDTTFMTSGPMPFSAQSSFIEPRVRGRQANFLFQSQDLGSFWRIGLVRYRVAKDGRNA